MEFFNSRLVKSPFLQTVGENGNIVIWHSLFGQPKIISQETLDFLNIFIEPSEVESLKKKFEIDSVAESVIQEFIDDYYLIPIGFNERDFLKTVMDKRKPLIISGSLISYLELIVAEICNFGCLYCIHFNSLSNPSRRTSKKIMDFTTAKQAIDWYLSILMRHNKQTAEINFGGGEPLLAWELIEKVLKYCLIEYCDKISFNFSINTNATLITSEIVRILKKYKVSIASSLDGLKEGNDLVRLTKNGKGTFNRIIKGFNILKQQGYPLDGFAVTVNGKNFKLLNAKLIDWATLHNMSEVRIDIDVVGIVGVPINEIVNKFIYLRHYAKDCGISVTGFWERPVENLNNSALKSHVAFCGAVRGNSLCVNPVGQIFSCGYDICNIGDITNINTFFYKKGKYFCLVNGRQTGNFVKCQGCIIEGQCAGGCNITQTATINGGVDKVNFMCELFCTMTKELLLEQLRETVSGH